jgi:hypothetical protein
MMSLFGIKLNQEMASQKIRCVFRTSAVRRRSSHHNHPGVCRPQHTTQHVSSRAGTWILVDINIGTTAAYVNTASAKTRRKRQCPAKQWQIDRTDRADSLGLPAFEVKPWHALDKATCAEHSSLFRVSLCLSRACLGKSSVFSIHWRTNDAFFRTALRVLLERILGLLPLHQQRVVDPVMVAVALVCAHYQKTPLFLSAFPMFVPSLSWQNHHVLL